MVYGIILNQGRDFESLMELRELTEVGILRLSMRKRTEEGMAVIKEKLDALREAILTNTNAFEVDNAFHDAVASLSENSLVMKIDQIVRILTYAVRQKTVQTMIEEGRGQELLKAHEDIYQVLLNRDDAGLEEIIRKTYFLDVIVNNQ